MNDKIFREYDIRGVVGSDLTREVAFSLGGAYATFLKRTQAGSRRVSVGRDIRLSSPELASGLIGGITAAGIDVIDIGVCPTPVQYFSLHRLDLDGGIMVTGSHNPSEYNGFKISAGKDTIYGDDIQRIKEIALSEGWKASSSRGSVSGHDIVSDYKAYMLDRFSYLGSPEYRKLKIVVDAGNGTGGIFTPELLGAMGCEVIPLYCEPDGTFPNHHPDPTVLEYIRDLIAKTRETGADMGVGYDGDADRIGAVDRMGTVVWGDQLMVILSREILSRESGAKIIGDVKCSQQMFDEIKRNGGVPIMWKTGHSLVKQKMKEEGALIAGEFSGHIFIGDGYFGYDDAMYTTFRLIEIMKKTKKDIRGLLTDLPPKFFTPEIRVDCSDDTKKVIVSRVVRQFTRYRDQRNGRHPVRQLHTIDGARVVFDRGWGLVRASNTQPVIVMRVEADSEEALATYRAFLEEELKEAIENR